LGRKDSNRRNERDAKKKAGAAKTSRRPQRKKVCHFCKEKVAYVDFKDVSLLRKFVSDRGKIRARRITGTCVQHQRDVALAVKNAREVALLPYVIR
jgi:ribosomal protein S18